MQGLQWLPTTTWSTEGGWALSLRTRQFTSNWPGVNLQGLELKSGLGYGGRFGSLSLNAPEV